MKITFLIFFITSISLIYPYPCERVYAGIHDNDNNDNNDDMRSTDFRGHTKLYYAIKGNNLPLIKEILDKGFTSCGIDNECWSPLHVAIQVSNFKSFEFLVKNFPDFINKGHVDGISPLHLAVTNCEREMVDFLLKNGADINQRDHQGQTAFFKLVADYKGKMLKVLLSSKNKEININQEDIWGNTVLHNMLSFNNDRSKDVKSLIEYGADVNRLNLYKKSPLHLILFFNNNAKVFNILLENKADINLKDQKGKTLLMHLFQKGDLEKVDLLLANGAYFFNEREKLNIEEISSIVDSKKFFNLEQIKQIKLLELILRKSDFFSDQEKIKITNIFFSFFDKNSNLRKKNFYLKTALIILSHCPDCSKDQILSCLATPFSNYLTSYFKENESIKFDSASLQKRLEAFRTLRRIYLREITKSEYFELIKYHQQLAQEYLDEGKLNQALWKYIEAGTINDLKKARDLNRLIREILEKGKIKKLEVLGKGSTKPYLVLITYIKDEKKYEIRAVLKKDVGAVYSHIESEVFSSLLNDKIGARIIPISVLRSYKGELHSLQYFWEGEKDAPNHTFEAKSIRHSFPAHDLYLFDYLTQNADRHKDNFFISPNKDIAKRYYEIVGIDNSGLWGRGINLNMIKDFKDQETLAKYIPTPAFLRGLKRMNFAEFKKEILAIKLPFGQKLATEEELDAFNERRLEIIDLYHNFFTRSVDEDGKSLIDIYDADRTMVRGREAVF